MTEPLKGRSTQMVLERGEAGDRLATDAEGRNAIGDHFLCFRDDLEDRPTQALERAAFRLLEAL